MVEAIKKKYIELKGLGNSETSLEEKANALKIYIGNPLVIARNEGNAWGDHGKLDRVSKKDSTYALEMNDGIHIFSLSGLIEFYVLL